VWNEVRRFKVPAKANQPNGNRWRLIPRHCNVAIVCAVCDRCGDSVRSGAIRSVSIFGGGHGPRMDGKQDLETEEIYVTRQKGQFVIDCDYRNNAGSSAGSLSYCSCLSHIAQSNSHRRSSPTSSRLPHFLQQGRLDHLPVATPASSRMF